MRDGFIGWQCRIRQHALRVHGGRPSPAMRPRVLGADGREISSAMTVLLIEDDPSESIAQFRHMVRKTHDPAVRLEAAVKLLSASEDPAHVARALAQGARGYVLKSARAEVLQHVLSLILAGEIYVPPMVMARRFGGDEAEAFGKLTPREREVLARVVDGLSNKAIAQALSIGEGTVKVHLKAVLRKLDVANRTQAATLAVRLGWSPADAALV